MDSLVGMREIWKARQRIAEFVAATPLIYSDVLSERAERPVYLKLETANETGSFKVRGAANKILSLSNEQKKRGVAAFSTGNHGLAVASIARKLGIEATICVSDRVPEAKLELLKRLGAHIEVTGSSQDAAAERCERLEKERGLIAIPPFDDPFIIAGQGTIGLELLEALPDLTDAVIPLSGGGLLSGIGLALKVNCPDIRVTGVSMTRSAVMHESLKAGKPLELDESETLADSLLGGIGLDNRHTFQMAKKYMDNSILISEQDIARSMAFMLTRHRMIVEGAAATGVAAVLKHKIPHKAGSMAIIISGHNVGMDVLKQVLQQYG
ncbi:hydroxyectoine utilization dehydratase EutB [Planococcus lenghuensis]|uniref:threonine ammonia-lyase n=2 Tax=Planococcus lenghuensis TaxID=2213202 RepID=A0A1Q2L3K3_9BACL|nr:hydroxyectoine utilization dehydratase EutB [Planococcus lenghuensis]